MHKVVRFMGSDEVWIITNVCAAPVDDAPVSVSDEDEDDMEPVSVSDEGENDIMLMSTDEIADEVADL